LLLFCAMDSLIITWNATITDVHTDEQTSVDILQRVEK
jgi:hypothetical protein